MRRGRRKPHNERHFGCGKIAIYTLKDVLDSFGDGVMLEAKLDEKNHITQGVAVASTRKSLNGYEYSDKSFQTLTSMLDGARMMLDHPDDADKHKVRSVRDWAGVFHNPRRSGDRITADLHVREAYWPLLKDVATMTPGLGLSINSRVKVQKVRRSPGGGVSGS
jgi:hypothetical protein